MKKKLMLTLIVVGLCVGPFSCTAILESRDGSDDDHNGMDTSISTDQDTLTDSGDDITDTDTETTDTGITDTETTDTGTTDTGTTDTGTTDTDTTDTGTTDTGTTDTGTTDTDTTDTDTTDTGTTDTGTTDTDTTDTDTTDTDPCGGGPVNACGGCTTLAADPGDPCGDCGLYTCATGGDLDCVTPSPAPAPRCRETGAARQECINGQWTDVSSCSAACHEGQCVPCVPGETRCYGTGGQEYCTIAYSWAYESCLSDETCVAALDRCAECSPGDATCVGNVRHECTTTGTWASISSCTSSQYCDPPTGTCQWAMLHREDLRFELLPPENRTPHGSGGTLSLEDILDTAAGFRLV